ncbi:hypothetical protein ACHAQA_002720 [Verticillium albo-atrum]
MPFNTPRSTRVRNRLVQNEHTPSATPSSSRKQRLNGLYANGLWYCNCEPRCEAKQFPVKKKGPNKGKLFWTCMTRSCEFFLWDEDAISRAMGVTVSTVEEPLEQTGPEGPLLRTSLPKPPSPLLKNSKQPEQPAPPSTAPSKRSPKRTLCDFYPKSPKKQTVNALGPAPVDVSFDEDAELAGPSSTAVPRTPSADAKRKRVQFEEEDLIGDLSSDEERQLDEVVTRSSQKLRAGISPPPNFTTPATQRTAEFLNGMPTPAVARTLFPGPDPKRSKATDESRTISTGLQSPQETPITNRTRDALQSSPTSHGDADTDLTEEVMTLLKDQHLAPALARALRDTLDRHAARARGTAMGRDAVRGQLKAKDERISQLQERVVAVENKNKAMRASITDMKAGLQNLYAQH